MARRKNRWVVAKVHFTDINTDGADCSRVLTRDNFETELLQLSNTLFGHIGGGFLSDSSNVVVTNEAEGIVLFQTKREFLPKLLCVLRCIETLQKIPLSLEIIHVGGTLHKCKKFVFSNLLETLAQLHSLSIAGIYRRKSTAKSLIETIGDLCNIRQPTDN